MIQKFKLNWIYICFSLVAVGGGLLFLGFSTTRQVYQEWARGLPISGGMNWPIVFAIDVLFLIMFLGFLWQIYRNLNTEFNEEYIVQPSVFGRKKINFNEVSNIRVFNGVGYHIISADKKIVISPYLYSNPQEVISFLEIRVRKPF
ncbi:MAG: hypothetical protein ACXWRE_04490 [Pseudobdellovibrionaceae bacterium]